MDANKEYPNNYLNEVIFKIEYSPILELYGNNPRVAGSFQSAIYEKFPNVKIKRNKEITFNIDPQSGKPMSTTDEGHLLWIFDSGNGETVELTATSLSLSYEGNAYVSFDEFLKDIMLLIDSIKIYPVKNFSFIGLRYINQFDDFDLKN